MAAANDTRLKIAVFIDFDNIEIGVKTTLGAQFDVGAVLEAVKERGEVVTKIAYGDWKRAGDHSRALSQHAVRLVQRNLTPGGDKNGADINLALDALEMALTHPHINAYVIVGGDSDFITLVEKLKQYDKQVLVVGGRAFTSVILQKNCHEFIAYENLMAPQPGARQARERARPAAQAQTPLREVFPLVKRALGVLSEREVSPQIGLLKSTLLQLDSTFSERDYGASTFRDFVEKLAQAGLVIVNQSGRNLFVELRDGRPALAAADGETGSEDARRVAEQPARPAAPVPVEAPPPIGQPEDAVRLVRSVFESASTPPRWPMYVRNVKQILKSADPSFDERRYGINGVLELVRACQRDGVLRLERDRRGVLRVFQGAALQREPMEAEAAPQASGVLEETVTAETVGVPEEVRAPLQGLSESPAVSVVAVEGEVLPTEAEPAQPGAAEPGSKAKRRRRAAPDGERKSRPTRKAGAAKAPASAPRRTSRTRQDDSKRSPRSENAD
jgi:uncharacterized LabA/DUF88 family protein